MCVCSIVYCRTTVLLMADDDSMVKKKNVTTAATAARLMYDGFYDRWSRWQTMAAAFLGLASIPCCLAAIALVITSVGQRIAHEMRDNVNGHWEDDCTVLLGRDVVQRLQISEL